MTWNFLGSRHEKSEADVIKAHVDRIIKAQPTLLSGSLSFKQEDCDNLGITYFHGRTGKKAHSLPRLITKTHAGLLIRESHVIKTDSAPSF